MDSMGIVFHTELAFTSFNSFHLNKCQAKILNYRYHLGINFVIILVHRYPF